MTRKRFERTKQRRKRKERSARKRPPGVMCAGKAKNQQVFEVFYFLCVAFTICVLGLLLGSKVVTWLDAILFKFLPALLTFLAFWGLNVSIKDAEEKRKVCVNVWAVFLGCCVCGFARGVLGLQMMITNLPAEPVTEETQYIVSLEKSDHSTEAVVDTDMEGMRFMCVVYEDREDRCLVEITVVSGGP